ncbi:MAG: leucine-rich repeat protein [Prevotellaceae bacterium]|nr:leucine-rich repeat protein [Prevotellaceae bacterium]
MTEQDLSQAIEDEHGAKYRKDGTEIIGDSAFFGCSRLTTIAIPPSVNTIGEEAFSWCHRDWDNYYMQNKIRQEDCLISF